MNNATLNRKISAKDPLHAAFVGVKMMSRKLVVIRPHEEIYNVDSWVRTPQIQPDRSLLSQLQVVIKLSCVRKNDDD